MWRERCRKILVAPAVSERPIYKYIIFTMDGPAAELAPWFPALNGTSEAPVLMTVEQGLPVRCRLKICTQVWKKKTVTIRFARIKLCLFPPPKVIQTYLKEKEKESLLCHR